MNPSKEASEAAERAGNPWPDKGKTLLFEGQLESKSANPGHESKQQGPASPVENTMKVQIKRVSPHQCAKICAIMAGLTVLLILIPMVLVVSSHPDTHAGRGELPIGTILTMMPILYSAMTYILTFIAALLYNLFTPILGGIEYETETAGADGRFTRRWGFRKAVKPEQ